MVNNINNKCLIENCIKQPVFNFPTEKKGIYCVIHKKENMIDIKSSKCIENDCIKRPSFNLATEITGIYCADHKKQNMIDVKHKKCVRENCTKTPIFNLPTETKGLYCADHKTEDMVDVKHKKCIYSGCNKRPTFNFPVESKGIYCVDHKTENMIDVTNKKCIHEHCTKNPNYNLPTESKGIYCVDHKQIDMINVTNKKCQVKKCKEDAIFGFVGKKKQFCNEHKEKNMSNLVTEYKCTKCDKEYDFIIDNQKYCLEHCPNKDYEIKLKKKCKYCDIEEKSNFVCSECKKISNKKEWAVVRYIKKNIDTPFTHNSSQPVKECSNKRPDVFFELDKHCVIVEIDENQHKSYQESCECARINEIFNSIGGKSVIFIRYNPDKTYNTHNGNKEIKFETGEKLKLLIDTIKQELIKNYDKICVKIIQLYYDDNYKKYEQLKEEDIINKVAI